MKKTISKVLLQIKEEKDLLKERCWFLEIEAMFFLNATPLLTKEKERSKEGVKNLF